MKKFIILIALLLSFMPVYAADCSSADTMICPAVPKVNGPISATFSRITGMNAIIEATLESQVKKQLNKALTGDFKVEITPFGAKSMLQGKFKKISFHSDSAYLEGIYLSNITAESLCGYNHFIYKNSQVYTNENFLMGFSADITSDDLQKSISTPQYLKLMNSMNVSMGNISLFKIFDPRAEIKNNRLVFSLRVASPLTFNEPKLISTSMGIAVENGQFVFTDVKTTPGLSSANLNTILPIINKLNPFVFHAGILNNPDSIIKIKDVNFSDNKIIVKGLVIVPKNYYNN